MSEASIERVEEQPKRYPIKQSAGLAGGAALTGAMIDWLAHLGPTGLLVSGLAGYVAWQHGPEIVAYVRERWEEAFPGEQESDEQPEPESEDEQPRKQGRTFFEHAFGLNRETDRPKEARPEENMPAQPQGSSGIPALFKLDAVLDAVNQVNEHGSVYFGQSAAGQVALPLNQMYHVLDVSSSGKGKSNRFRLAMMQLVGNCEVYFINPFANDVKAVTDERKIEVWKPIFDRLANGRPIKEGSEILQLMTALVNEIENREKRESRGDFAWQYEPIFVFIDELPEVFARCPEAVKLLDKIGRTGRQFCVFSWVATQTAAVSEIGQSTAAQANYKTRIYGGGDRNSSGRMMKGAIPMEDETMLQTQGAGLTLMLADGFARREFVRAPLVTNEALFAFFGLPPFRLQDWLVQPEKMVSRQPSQRLGAAFTKPFTDVLSREEIAPAQGHFELVAPRESSVKGQSERVRESSCESPEASNIDAILQAIETLESEQKPLTLNAIAKQAGLTWRQWDEIEHVVTRAGYNLVIGKGRPKE